MKEYQCFEKCYDQAMYRPGDILKFKDDVPEFVEAHFILVSDNGNATKPVDPEGAVKALAKKHKISEKMQAEIYTDAEASEPHEKLQALSNFIKE